MMSGNEDQINFLKTQGLTLLQGNRLEEAKAVFTQISAINPTDPYIWIMLSNINGQLGLISQAGDCCLKAIRLQPTIAVAHSNLGNVYTLQGKINEALGCYQEALRLDPSNALAYSNLGNLLSIQGRIEEATVCYKEALRINPNLVETHNNLGNILKDMGRYNEALACFREALRLDPHYAMAHSNLLFAVSYQSNYDAEAQFMEHVRWGELHGQASAKPVIHSNTPNVERRLRIGYVSPDFRTHPIGFFIEQVLIHHDKEHCEIFCYYNHRENDKLTARLRQYAHHWRDIAEQTDEIVSQQIRKDGIDILVDLAGHTMGNRLTAFAHKPAPIQATWLGYIATTGLPAMDYIIADRFVIPPQEERHYVERVVRLPHSYLCFSPPDYAIAPSPLPALASGQITYGCFNNPAKLTEGVIACWSKLLHALPKAQLYLKYKSFGDKGVQQRYQSLFAAQGIAAERVKFSGYSPRHELLAAYQEVDIGLDPFPYNGGTTTVEALWMGVPVVSLRGDHRFVSHVGETVLMNAGLGECVADSEEAYIAKAIELADDLSHLTGMRQQLRTQLLNSPLCDGTGFTRDLEAAYRTMWKSWCQTRKNFHDSER